MTTYRDRTRNYIPEGLRLPEPWRYEVTEQGKLAPVTWGLADELNRDRGTWDWADVSGDGSHWSHFKGHRQQVDIEVHTFNHRRVHDWKGYDEIRAATAWKVSLDRVQVGEGSEADPLEALLAARSYIQRLNTLHLVQSWRDYKILQGRKVWYYSDPAIVSGFVLDQGCVLLEPDGTVWSKRQWDFEEEGSTDSVKVELISPHIWWYRD